MAATGTRWSDHALKELRRAGHRAGGARTAVVELLGRQDCCLSVQEIFDALRERDRAVGIASVYRALDLLAEMRLVQRVDVGDGGARYEATMPDGGHHHHAVCGSCGDVHAFEDDRLEAAIDRLSDRLGFTVTSHEVVLHGACPGCEQ